MPTIYIIFECLRKYRCYVVCYLLKSAKGPPRNTWNVFKVAIQFILGPNNFNFAFNEFRNGILADSYLKKNLSQLFENHATERLQQLLQAVRLLFVYFQNSDVDRVYNAIVI